MKVVELDAGSRWDDFVRASINGTLFHTLRFLGYHPEKRFEFINLGFVDDGDLVCVIPGGRVKGESGYRFRSPVGASFGGHVLAQSDLKVIEEVMGTFQAWLVSEGFSGCELVLPPPCYWKRWDEALEFALISAGYHLVSMDATAVVDLSSFERSELKPVLQRNLRKAEKSGVTIRTSGDPTAFYDVLLRSLAIKGAHPTHSLDEIRRLINLFHDEIVLFEAVIDGQSVGGCLIFRCNAACALAFYICDDPEFRSVRVTDLLLFESSRWLKAQGQRYFDLGTVSFGAEVNWGLLRFKAKMAGLIQTRRHYEITLGG